ncbi:HD-GYP domain-containing protein [Paludibacterium denitrificans]|uniref:HD-GYP domain-containing protein n=1 Tax=Paludibacterium denitrificans TaxID=2675226 RepID=UPI001E2A43BA|nr:HD domain-containing phosphohydrolase [Paludibacterium denitrificans]
MKTHTTIGGKLLEGDDSPLLTLAHEIALTHHEKWDGSGYPAGLRGENIPLSGRIVAIADVFDALTSHRPYKKAWTLDSAINYINEEADHHFDPQVVAWFNDALEDILKIYRSHPEITEDR